MNEAVVVGLCAHGLAVVRALADEGVNVTAIERNTRLPGVRTNKAKVVLVEDINNPGLVNDLIELAQHRAAGKPILFLTNDNMVRHVAMNWERLANLYQLSWGKCRAQILQLLDKRFIQGRCEEAGICYPRTKIMESGDVDYEGIRYPAIMKPAQPLGSFKALIVKNRDELVQTISRFPDSFPLLVQDWIAGPDSNLHVCTLLLDGGLVRAIFTGRKLASFPPRVGQTAVMEPIFDENIREIALSFFDGLKLSGPVSIEAKLGTDGRYYLVEPTVGRTDYFVDVLTKNGVNFPIGEYELAKGSPWALPIQENNAVWFDTERDRTSFIRQFSCLFAGRSIRRPIFPYLRLDDLHPCWISTLGALFALYRGICRRCIATIKMKGARQTR